MRTLLTLCKISAGHRSLFDECAFRAGTSISHQDGVDQRRRTIAVLQQLQVLIGAEPTRHDPSLADVERVLRAVQQAFGRYATLETVIQTLVAQDLAQQYAQRRSLSASSLKLPQQEVMG